MSKYHFEKGATYSETLGPAMDITDQADADEYFEALVELGMQYGKSRPESEAISRNNLGYWTGYCGPETAERVFRLFKCSHPIFGKSQPTTEEALKAGLAMVKAGAQ